MAFNEFNDTPNKLDAVFVQRTPDNTFYEQINISASNAIVYLNEHGKIDVDLISVWASKYGIGGGSSGSSVTSSFSISSSYAISASHALFANTSSYSVSSSYAVTSSYSFSSSYAISSSYSLSSSYSISSSYAISASHALFSDSASYSISSSYTISSSYAEDAAGWIKSGSTTYTLQPKIGIGVKDVSGQFDITNVNGGDTTVNISSSNGGISWLVLKSDTVSSNISLYQNSTEIGRLTGGSNALSIYNKVNNNGYISLFTNTGSVDTERVRITNNGFIGVNKINPAGNIDVAGNVIAYSFTGSLQGTSSWAFNSQTASLLSSSFDNFQTITTKNYLQGNQTVNIGPTYQDAFSVLFASSQSAYVNLTVNHFLNGTGSIAFYGQYLLIKDGAGAYTQPGIILEESNWGNVNIWSQIYDPGTTSSNESLTIQLKSDSGTISGSTLTYEVRGEFLNAPTASTPFVIYAPTTDPNLWLWLSSDYKVNDNGVNLIDNSTATSSWGDRSGHGRDYVCNNGFNPYVSSSASSSIHQKTIVFDHSPGGGSSNGCSLFRTSTETSLTQPFAMFVLIKSNFNATSTKRWFWDGANTASSAGLILSGNLDQVTMNCGNDGPVTDLPTGQFAILTCVYNGNNSTIQVNNGAVATGDVGSNIAQSIFFGGFQGGGLNNFGRFEMAAVIVTQGVVPSADQQTRHKNWLANFGGLTI